MNIQSSETLSRENVFVNNTLGVATSELSHWKDPEVFPPPRGVKLNLLTWGGIQVSGQWFTDSHLSFAAWAPVLSKPEWLKKRLEDFYSGKFIPKKS